MGFICAVRLLVFNFNPHQSLGSPSHYPDGKSIYAPGFTLRTRSEIITEALLWTTIVKTRRELHRWARAVEDYVCLLQLRIKHETHKMLLSLLKGGYRALIVKTQESF